MRQCAIPAGLHHRVAVVLLSYPALATRDDHLLAGNSESIGIRTKGTNALRSQQPLVYRFSFSMAGMKKATRKPPNEPGWPGMGAGSNRGMVLLGCSDAESARPRSGLCHPDVRLCNANWQRPCRRVEVRGHDVHRTQHRDRRHVSEHFCDRH